MEKRANQNPKTHQLLLGFWRVSFGTCWFPQPLGKVVWQVGSFEKGKVSVLLYVTAGTQDAPIAELLRLPQDASAFVLNI